MFFDSCFYYEITVLKVPHGYGAFDQSQDLALISFGHLALFHRPASDWLIP